VDVVYDVIVVREPEIEVVIVDAGKVVVKESVSVIVVGTGTSEVSVIVVGTVTSKVDVVS
jgi:hypothetical protein